MSGTLSSELARRFCRRLFKRVYGPYALRQIEHGGPARLRGRTFQTDPTVLHPVHFLSTRVLVDAVRELPIRGKRVLDMGCGSGAIGIFAAAAGAIVTACDINARAATLARENFGRNLLSAEVLESDLFASLGGRVFDLICFNLPYYDGEPGTPFEAALFGGKDLATVQAFARGCRGALAPGGTVMVLFSEDARRQAIVEPFVRSELVLVDERVRHRWFERFFVLSFRQRSPLGGPNNPGQEERRQSDGQGPSLSSRLARGMHQP
jgi:methylase of polypeptide subunit release factors